MLRKAMWGFVTFFWALGASAEPVTIAALGDSLTQGYGLPQEQGFVPQLQNWLQRQGKQVSLINAGVSGDTTAGGLARVDWTLAPEVDALIVALGGNDFLRGIDPSVSRQNLDGILGAADRAGVSVLLIGMQAPGNYGPEYKAEFDGIYPDLAVVYDTVFLPNFFSGFGDTTDPAAVRELMQGDGIHPNATGVSKIVEAVGPAVLQLIDRVED